MGTTPGCGRWAPARRSRPALTLSLAGSPLLLPLTGPLATAVLATAVALTAASRPMPLEAQAVPDTAPRAALVAGLDGSALAAGTWHYVSTVVRGGESMELARRTLTVAAADHQGTPAWLLLDQTVARGQTMTDSLFVTRADLRPLRQAAEMGPLRVATRFTADSVTGAMSVVGGSEAPIALAASPGLVVNSGMLEAVLTLLPLAAGWTGTIDQLALAPTGAVIVPVLLEVVGEDSTSAAAGGPIPTWHLTATAAGAAQHLWVAKAGGRLVNMVTTPPHAEGVRYETVLVECGVLSAECGPV